MVFDRRLLLSVSTLLVASCDQPKRGLGGLSTCHDASALNLADSWYYNWGPLPHVQGQPCENPPAAEFVPMIWGCWGNCTDHLPDNFTTSWEQAGVRALLGFNEPDNDGQSNMLPEKAAGFWPQIQKLASRMQPALTLVSPAMTHWDDDGRSDWLDQFFGALARSGP